MHVHSVCGVQAVAQQADDIDEESFWYCCFKQFRQKMRIDYKNL
jgi:hypothetical protein